MSLLRDLGILFDFSGLFMYLPEKRLHYIPENGEIVLCLVQIAKTIMSELCCLDKLIGKY